MNQVKNCLLNRPQKSLLRFFKQNLSNKKEQTLNFSPTKGATVKTGVEQEMSEAIVQQQPKANIRFYRWWSTNTGRNVSLALMISGSALVAYTPVLKNTVFMKYIRELYQSYQGGLPAKIPNLFRQNVIMSALQDVGIYIEECSKIKFFVSQGELNSWGDVNLDGGAIIGVPFWFPFRHEREIDLDKMNFGRKGTTEHKSSLSEEEKESDCAKSLVEGMILSEEAKKFGLAREIVKVKEVTPFYMEGMVGGLSVMMCVIMSKYANLKLNLFRQPPLLRGLNYLFCFNASALTYVTVKDSTNRQVQAKCDEAAAKISRQYAQGGVEYYTKLAQRNAAKRELMLGGKEGYNRNGEEIGEWIRRRNLTIRERKEICEKVLASFS